MDKDEVIPNSEEIFLELVSKMRTEKLPTHWDIKMHLWTKTMKNIFKKIGESYGYFVPDIEWMKLDQIWVLSKEETDSIIVAIEHENKDSFKNILEDELQKLIDIKAYVKILMFYDKKPSEKEIVEKIKDKIKTQKLIISGEKYLIILGIAHEDPDDPSFTD